MKKLLIALGVVVVAAVGYRVFIYKSCEQPPEQLVAIASLNCAMGIITESLRVEVCRELKREDECQFVEEDREAINAIVSGKIRDCVKEVLEPRGFCTDKLGDL